MQRFSFVPKPCFVGYFFCSSRIFHFTVPPRGYFFVIIRHTESFLTACESSRWSHNCFQQLPLHFWVCCSFWDLSEGGGNAVCKCIFCILVWRKAAFLQIMFMPAKRSLWRNMTILNFARFSLLIENRRCMILLTNQNTTRIPKVSKQAKTRLWYWSAVHTISVKHLLPDVLMDHVRLLLDSKLSDIFKEPMGSFFALWKRFLRPELSTVIAFASRE